MKTSVLKAVAPVLLVKDVMAAANHYRAQLGFAYDQLFGEPPTFVIVRRDGMSLMLKQADDPKHVVPHWTVSSKLCSAYFWVSGIDELHRELVQRGARIDYAAISPMAAASSGSRTWTGTTLRLASSCSCEVCSFAHLTPGTSGCGSA